MMSGSQPMPPEQVAEELQDAEELEWDAERARIALEEEAEAARAAAESAGAEEPSLIDRIKDLLDGDAEPAPEAQPAEG
jgi:hypothetical protein